MRGRVLSCGVVGALLLVLSPPVHAASVTTPKSLPQAGNVVQEVQFRRCWWEDGHRICRYRDGWGFGYSTDDED
jgi:hypothetical protein